MTSAPEYFSYASSYVTVSEDFFLDTFTIFFAPRLFETSTAVFDVPPVPSIRTVLFSRSSPALLMSARIPKKSVLNPKSFPSVLTIVFTAPIFFASSDISSRNGITACLYGIVTFMPEKSRF